MVIQEEEEEGSNSNWEGMLKRWSVDKKTHHLVISHGTVYDHPANSYGTPPPDPPQWRGATKERFMMYMPTPGYGIADRVYDISRCFPIPYKSDSEEDRLDSEDESEDGEDASEDDEVKKKKAIEDEVKKKKAIEDEVKGKEELMDELQAYVESVDVAKVLHSDDRLLPFLHHVLPHKHAVIRAKGAEVISTMVQNNPTSQELVIKEKGLKLLLDNFTSDPDATSRTKAFGAISALIRNNKSGITAFRREKGYEALKNALISGSVCQREVINLIQYLLQENNLYSQKLNLAFSDDAKVREAGLRGLRVLEKKKKKWYMASW